MRGEQYSVAVAEYMQSSRCNGICLGLNVQIFSTESRHTVYRFVCSNRDRLGFYAEFKIIFETLMYAI